MPGRPPIPLEIHKARGTDRKSVYDRIAGTLQVHGEFDTRPPRWFTKGARRIWKHITSQPEYRAVLTALDRDVMVHYCALQDRMEREQEIRSSGREPSRGEKLSAVEMQNLMSLRMQLGMTPASRSKVKVPTSATKENKWAVLDNGKSAYA